MSLISQLLLNLEEASYRGVMVINTGVEPTNIQPVSMLQENSAGAGGRN